MAEEEKKESESKLDEKGNKLRQIILETDGTNVNVVKSEVAGKIEFIGILETVIDYLRRN